MKSTANLQKTVTAAKVSTCHWQKNGLHNLPSVTRTSYLHWNLRKLEELRDCLWRSNFTKAQEFAGRVTYCRECKSSATNKYSLSNGNKSLQITIETSCTGFQKQIQWSRKKLQSTKKQVSKSILRTFFQLTKKNVSQTFSDFRYIKEFWYFTQL